MSRSAPHAQPGLAQVLGALSHVLDLAAGRAPGHALRTCWIGIWLGRALGLRGEELYELYYTLLLGDAGRGRADAAQASAPGEAGMLARLAGLWGARRRGEREARERARVRAARGAEVARRLGFGRAVAQGIGALDERWSGRGRPERRSGRSIPRAAQLALLAREIVLAHGEGERLAAEELVRSRRGTWFDPELVDVFDVVTLNPEMWNGLREAELQERVRALEPNAFVVSLTDERLDRLAATFGGVLDDAGPFGPGRAERVAALSVAIGRELGLASDRLRWLRRSAQLGDAGELAGGDAELVERLDPFRELARAAGQGFGQGTEGGPVALELRLVDVAAAFDARTGAHPAGEPPDRGAALAELEAQRGTRFDANALDALGRVVEATGRARAA